MKLRSVLHAQRKRIFLSEAHTPISTEGGLNTNSGSGCSPADGMVKAPFRGFGGIAAMAMLLLLLASCHKDSTTTPYTIPSGLSLLSSGYAAGAAIRVEVYSAATPYVGYNKLYIALYDSASNTRLTNAQISLSAGLSTGTTAPVETPVLNASNGLFSGAAVFTSASGSGAWTLNIPVAGTSGKAGVYSCPVSVTQPSPARSYSVMTADSASLFISIVQPTSPQLGVNNFELVVDKMISTGSYAADSSYMIMINPTMPSMTGMGSPNNVNPVYAGSGHYVGKVDFIMSGGWDIYVDLSRNGMVCDSSHYFALNL